MNANKQTKKLSKKPSNVEIIQNYIRSDYNPGQPILTSTIYNEFPQIKQGNIRQILRRLVNNQEIERASEGVYFIPKKNPFMDKFILSTDEIIEKKYIISDSRIGYKSGLSLANQLGLTQQMANVETIISNSVSDKKRSIKINNGKIVINSPRITVTENNYKLLQVLDILDNFESYSELTLEFATPIIKKYLKDLNLSKKEIEDCVESYPLQTQVYFYKMGVYYELIR